MLRKLSCLLPLAVLLLAFVAPLRCHAQKMIVVKGVNPPPNYPYTTIQSGIDAASDGDTVMVELGGYTESINFNGKAITVTGSSVAMPVIKGVPGGAPAVVFQNGETSKSVLSYFLILNAGDISGGASPGAIYIDGTSPSILNNTISQSNCYGVYVEEGAPLIQGNEIDGTEYFGFPQCPPGNGVGIFINGNTSSGLPLISGNLIQKNVQGGENVLQVPGGGGGGITVAGPAIIENNTIRDNSANFSVGGGINVEASEGIFIVQNLIYGNSADCGGGGIAFPDHGPTGEVSVLIANNTIVDNSSGPRYPGGCAPSTQLFSAVQNDENLGPGIVLVNNILSGSSTDASVDCGEAQPPDEIFQPIFDHNILHNAGGSFFGQYCVDVSSKYGNLTADPGFDPNNPYQLVSGSPAIDAGNTSALQLFQQLSGAQLTTDFNGNPRVIDAKGKGYPTIDIGAYEYPDQPAAATLLPTTMVLSFTQGNDLPYTLTANVQSQLPPGPPTGDVTFFTDGVLLGSAEIKASGLAQLSGFALLPGTHALSATYPGRDAFSPATAIINIVVTTLTATSIQLQSDAIPAGSEPTRTSAIGQPVLFSVKVHADDGSIPQPITITSTDEAGVVTVLTAAPGLIPNSSGMATLTYAGFSVAGQYQLEAAYAGDATHTAATETITQTVVGYPTTTIFLNCPAAPLPYGATALLSVSVTSPNGIPTGPIYFSAGGVAFGGNPQLVNGGASATYTATESGVVFAQYFAVGAYAESSASCNINVLPRDTLALRSSSPLVGGVPTSPAYSPITFTATLTTGDGLRGTYLLSIKGQPTVTMAVDAAGTTATYTTSALAAGQYSVSATFMPSDGSPSITANLYPYELVTAAVGDFTLTGPSSVMARTESPASGTVNLASMGFQGTVALTCNLPLPSSYTCSISPASVPLAGGGTGSATVTVSPTLKRAANDLGSRILFASLAPLTLVALAGFRRRRTLFGVLPLALLAVLLGSATACGNDIAYAATQPGSYPFTVTAAGTTKGGTAPVTHTLNITLVLTP